ncbi:hypothetical protein FHS43_003877 [Streptosporangium becharense]|uniref:HAD family hydrolase n=1 Tax=Streptosporangium becharense TaxID=1816182 RepID=A0A7W9IHB4_9ACTN|nr:hypothetical protein [Streptosporangium becharense]MBB2912594.1 hypothetical protein [Streptosporangium becharense]MBB5820576.1 hypothetical protein [Streptosporangium becharense]
MQRLALFDLDNTLVSLDEAFQVRTAEFADGYGLGREAVDGLIALDRTGPAEVVDAYALFGLEHVVRADVAELTGAQGRDDVDSAQDGAGFHRKPVSPARLVGEPVTHGVLDGVAGWSEGKPVLVAVDRGMRRARL